MKTRILMVLMAMVALPVFGATPIANLKLTTGADGGGQVFTNLVTTNVPSSVVTVSYLTSNTVTGAYVTNVVNGLGIASNWVNGAFVTNTVNGLGVASNWVNGAFVTNTVNGLGIASNWVNGAFVTNVVNGLGIASNWVNGSFVTNTVNGIGVASNWVNGSFVTNTVNGIGVASNWVNGSFVTNTVNGLGIASNWVNGAFVTNTVNGLGIASNWVNGAFVTNTVTGYGYVTASITNQCVLTNDARFQASITNIVTAATNLLSGTLVYTNGVLYGGTNDNDGAYVTTNNPTYTQTVFLASRAWQNPAAATNWTWTSNGREITMTGYTGPNDVVIPDMLDGLPVTGFGTVFRYNPNITSISGKNITSIANYAFQSVATLTSVSFPMVTSVGIWAFYDCSGLAYVNIPVTTNIATVAFGNCMMLTAVVFSIDAPVIGANIYQSAFNAVNYVTSPTASGWGTTLGGRPVVRLPLYGNGSNIVGITSLQVGAVATNDARYLASITNIVTGSTNLSAGILVYTNGILYSGTNIPEAGIQLTDVTNVVNGIGIASNWVNGAFVTNTVTGITTGAFFLASNNTANAGTTNTFDFLKGNTIKGNVLILGTNINVTDPSFVNGSAIKIGDNPKSNVGIDYSTSGPGSNVSESVWMGRGAWENGSGAQNVVIGRGSGSMATGTLCNYIGYLTGAGNTNGNHNNAYGSYALGSMGESVNAGDRNSAFGGWTMFRAKGNKNEGFGYGTGQYLMGNGNTLYGYAAWYQGGYVSTSMFNTIIGYGAGYQSQGNENTFLGDSAGYQSTGETNIFIGVNAGRSSANFTNAIVIGNHASPIGNNTTMIGGPNTILTSIRGSTGINTTNPAATLDVNGSLKASNIVSIGNITLNGVSVLTNVFTGETNLSAGILVYTNGILYGGTNIPTGTTFEDVTNVVNGIGIASNWVNGSFVTNTVNGLGVASNWVDGAFVTNTVTGYGYVTASVTNQCVLTNDAKYLAGITNGQGDVSFTGTLTMSNGTDMLIGKASDASGVISNTVLKQGTVGSAFNIATQHILNGGMISTNLTNFTVSAWLYRTTASGYQGANQCYIFSIGDTYPNVGFALNNDYLGIYSSNTKPTSSLYLPLRQWSHCVWVWNNGSSKVYLNGSGEVLSGFGPIANATKFNFAYGDGYSERRLPGYIDEVSFWNRSLTDAEVNTLYNGGSGLYGSASHPLWASNCIAGYHLDENSGTAVTAFVGTNGTLSSASWTTGFIASEPGTGTVQVVKSSNGILAGETGRIQFGSYDGSAGTYNTYEGISHTLNILGTPKVVVTNGNIAVITNMSVSGTTTHSRPVVINGSSDAVQLSVKANATQNSNVLQTSTSGGAVTFGIRSDGLLYTSPSGTGSGIWLATAGGGLPDAAAMAFAHNVMIGQATGINVGGIDNVGIGGGNYYRCSGTRNVSIGYQSLYGYTSGAGGNDNVAVGEGAMWGMHSGEKNTAIGGRSMYNGQMFVTYNNTAIGYYSAYNLGRYSSNNVFLGTFAGSQQTTSTNTLIIDGLLRTSDVAERTNCLIVGTFATNRTNQTLAINANVSAISLSVDSLTVSGNSVLTNIPTGSTNLSAGILVYTNGVLYGGTNIPAAGIQLTDVTNVVNGIAVSSNWVDGAFVTNTVNGLTNEPLWIASSNNVLYSNSVPCQIWTNPITSASTFVNSVAFDSTTNIGGSSVSGAVLTLGTLSDPFSQAYDLLPIVNNGTATITRTMGTEFVIVPTATVFIATDNSFPTNGSSVLNVTVFYNDKTLGFGNGMTNTSALTSNAFNLVNFVKPYAATKFSGVKLSATSPTGDPL